MSLKLENPFSITKATEFTDLQINEYWVNYNSSSSQSFFELLNPNEFQAKYILGSKGCGKTHLLRYFSYSLQKIRLDNNVEKLLSADKYIGIYSVLDGLSSSRFEGKGIHDDQWKALFEYYFELYLANNLLEIINDSLSTLNLENDPQGKLVKAIGALFCETTVFDSINSIDLLITELSKLRRKIDAEILMAPFTRALDIDKIKILFSPGDLIFGIPKAIATVVPQFKDVKFIYILDEYEKLFEWQKVFINTIVWEKKNPCTFWIGARKHGYTTRMTKFKEEIKPGSEFQPIELDNIIRSDEELYKKFAKELFVKRIHNFYLQDGIALNSEEIAAKFKDKFERYSEDKILNIVIEKNKGKEYRHIKELKNKLLKGLEKKVAYGLSDKNEIDHIIENLISETENNPLEQKYTFFSFYQAWNDAKNELKNQPSLIMVSERIKSEYSKYKAGEKNDFSNIKEKFKKDFIAQLTSESKLKNVCYSGIDEFIDISWGNPRCFILILKKAFEYSMLRGEKPYEDGSVISLDTQYMAVYDTAKWFLDDAEIIGEKGKNLYKAINSLADLLKLYRFSDKPAESSVSSFFFTVEESSVEAKAYIDLAALHSLIIEIDSGRKEKNSGRNVKLFQLNKTIAPLWNLPTARRGTINLNKTLLDSIFNPAQFDKFEAEYKQVRRKLNAPAFCGIPEDGDTVNLELF